MGLVLTIKMNKLILQGPAYRRTLTFNKGLTVISGDKTSGKSLILSLIDYCLGKSKKIDLKVQRELNEYCDQIFLEIKINDEILTINRLLKEKWDKIRVYFCLFSDLNNYSPKIVDRDELLSLLMRKLNIDEYKLIKHQKHSNKQELELVSFRDIFRYIYIHQHELGTHDFLANKSTFKRYKNPHAFKMMFGLIDKDKDSLREQLVAAKNQIDEAHKVINGLKSYLKERDAEIYLELWNRSNDFDVEITVKKREKTEIILNNGRNNKNNENEMYISLKNELTEIANQIFHYQKQRNDLILSIRSKSLLREEYEAELAETEATIEINYKLIIPNQYIECPLCQSSLPHSHQEVNENTLGKIKKEITNKIKMITSMIENETNIVEEIDTKIKRWSKKQAIINSAIAEFVKETEVPFLSQLDSINSIINKLSREREIIKECLRMHNKIAEKERLVIELESEIKRLEGELEKLRVSEAYKDKVFEFLNSEYRGYMLRLKYDDLSETYISKDSHVPFYRGSSVYEHESGGLLLCMQISYLAAILRCKEVGYALGHPGFLMLDSLSKYLGTIKKERSSEAEENKSDTIDENFINDPEVYEELYKILIELTLKHQIIIVENTPPDIVDTYTRYTFLSGHRGLINESVNEYKEENE